MALVVALFAAPGAATTVHATSATTHVYDGSTYARLPESNCPERGRPAEFRNRAIPYAVDFQWNGVPAHPDVSASLTSTGYDFPERFVRAAGNAATTERPTRADEGRLVVVDTAGDAAKAGAVADNVINGVRLGQQLARGLLGALLRR